MWFPVAVIIGYGMVLHCPNLTAANDRRRPALWRGKALGIDRYWRYTGYAIGALLLGLVVQSTDAVRSATWVTAMLVALSEPWIALGSNFERQNN